MSCMFFVVCVCVCVCVMRVLCVKVFCVMYFVCAVCS